MTPFLDSLINSLASALLLAIAAEDMRRFRIRNGFVVALIALFALKIAVSGSIQEAGWHVAFGVAALMLMFGAYWRGAVGAGDTKLMAAACLWVGPENALVFATALLGFTVLYAGGARLTLLPVRKTGTKTKIPFGLSIAGAFFCVALLGN
jgi:prepilin peptidase CpaA